jgi:hypothetical protein
MTGRELLSQRMMELGASKQQTESKAVDYVLAILADGQGELDAISIFKEMRGEYLKAHKEMLHRATDYTNAKLLCEKRFKDLQEMAHQKIAKVNELIDEAKKRYDALLNMETPEMRDRYRMAVRYKEMAHTDNAYARTEYTKGLALIMAGMNTEKGEGNE